MGFRMNAEQFAYWLQGFAELNGGPPNEIQWAMIREHLGLLFNKVTKIVPAKQRDLLDLVGNKYDRSEKTTPFGPVLPDIIC